MEAACSNSPQADNHFEVLEPHQEEMSLLISR